MRITLPLVILVIIISLLLSFCTNTKDTVPYGKWECQEPQITLDINPASAIGHFVYYGTYQKDGEKIQVIINFPYSTEIAIYKATDWHNLSTSHGEELFRGTYKLNGNKIYYTLKPHWQEKTGIKRTIVFEKIQDYEAAGIQTLTPKQSIKLTNDQNKQFNLLIPLPEKNWYFYEINDQISTTGTANAASKPKKEGVL